MQLKARTIEADPAQMREVFNNLLTNAFEAVEKDKGLIQIQGIFNEKDRHIEISIRDNGYGIPAENINKIMEPFFTTKSQGTGLGLSVCSQVIRLHGGRIEVSSSKNKGSVFTLIIPEKPGLRKES
jgi:signal transduction histidine kinase